MCVSWAAFVGASVGACGGEIEEDASDGAGTRLFCAVFVDVAAGMRDCSK